MKNFKLNNLLFFLFILHGFFAFTQEKRISGKITDETSQPIPGVTVIVKGTAVGTATNLDGYYELDVPNNSDILKFSYIGYETVEITIGNQTTVNITLKESAAQLDQIVISGYRAAEQRAVKIKREALSVIEAITPADMGNYTDENIADAVQRVPGIQVERDDSGNGGGDRVSIRGIGPQFVNVTVNGRTPLSAGNEGIGDLRQFNMDVLPPEVIQGATIYKTSEAHLIEPGLGGLVNFQTAKPLSLSYKDGNNYYGAVNVRGAYNDFKGADGTLKPRISALFGVKSKNNKLGFFASALTSSDQRAYDATFARWRQQNITIDGTTERIYMPQMNYNPVREDRGRFGYSSALQWKPNEHWDVVADIVYSDYDITSFRDRRTLNFQTNGTLNGATTHKGYITSFLNNTNGNSERMEIYSAQYDTRTKNTIGGINLKWNNNGWTIAGDLSFSTLDFANLFNQGRYFSNLPGGVSFDSRNGGVPLVTYSEAEAADTANYALNNFGTLFKTVTVGDNSAFRLDIDKILNDQLTLKFGGRLNSSTIKIRRALATAASRVWDYSNQADAKQYFIDNYLTNNVTNYGNGTNVGVNNWVGFNHEFFRADNPTYFNQNYGGSLDTDGDIFDITDGDVPSWPAFMSDITEKTNSFYTQLNFKSAEGDALQLSGNVGLRAINTKITAKAFSSVLFSDPDDNIDDVNLDNTPSISGSERWDVTPSLNLNFDFTDNFKYRFSVVNTISRPDFADLTPTNTIRATNPLSTAIGTVNGSAVISNPDLKPYSVWQLDNTFEYYSKKGGAFVFSGFYKQLADFIIDQQTLGANADDLNNIGFPEAADQGLTFSDEQLYDVTKPVNYTGVSIYGFELGFVQPLSIISESLKNFGVQANYTFIDSKFDKDINNSETADQTFPGSSKHNFNGVLYFENSKLGIRFAYTKRSDFLRNFGGGSDVRANASYTEGYDQLNIRINYKVTPKLDLSISGQDLSAPDRRDYLLNDRQLWDRSTNKGQFYTFGVRYQI